MKTMDRPPNLTLKAKEEKKKDTYNLSGVWRLHKILDYNIKIIFQIRFTEMVMLLS